MIVLLNGPFGVGKTTAGELLVQKLENAMLYDPEELGVMLRKLVPQQLRLPEERTEDFQDMVLWKQLFVTVAEMLIKTYGRDLVIPMTLCDGEAFRWIFQSLEGLGQPVFHVCLLAEKPEIRRRLTERGDEAGSWPFRQLDRCMAAFTEQRELFSEIVHTDTRPPEDVVSYILKRIGRA